ncbi:MAG: endonuclease [Bacteroidales bacterium]|nr:endonuclease [Bacteroidales bacterium]
MKFKTLISLFLIIFSYSAHCQIPAGYYNDAIGKSGKALQQALCQIISGHVVVGYDDLWYYYQFTDLKPDSTIWDLYTDPYCSFTIADHGATGNNECITYNREHAFCQSWFGSTGEPPFSDIHHIFPVSSWINSYRNNNPYGEVTYPERQFQNGSKWGKNCFISTVDNAPTGTAFEPIDEFKGDIARALFYVATRYMLEDSNFCTDPSVAPMTIKSQLRPWALEMLKNWHILDPVSQKEIDRNNAIYTIQHNRNPYIDHPYLVDLVWGNDSLNHTFDPGYVPVSKLHITNVNIPTTKTVTIAFDTLIIPASVTSYSNYTISNGIIIDSAFCSQPNELTLHLKNGLTPGYPYYMIVRNIQSASGYFLRDTSITFVYGFSANHKPLIAWTFDTTASKPNTPKQIDADINVTGIEAKLYLDGTHSSSLFNGESSFNELTTFPGTRIGDPRISNAYDGYALSIIGDYANGKSLVWNFSTQFWENILVSFANRRTPTGFSQHIWECSFDGITFDTLYNLKSVADSLNLFEMKSFDFQPNTSFNRQQNIFLRLTIDSAYTVSGNNRFDNFTIYGQKCADDYVYSDTILCGEPYNKYGFQIPAIQGIGQLVFSRDVEMSLACDSSIILNLTIVNNNLNDGIETAEKHQQQKIIVYPNPAKEQCKIKVINPINEFEKMNIQLFDLAGQLLYQTDESINPFTNELVLPLHNLSSGIYLITLSSKNFFAKEKLVVY